jgi:hypothetical protein
VIVSALCAVAVAIAKPTTLIANFAIARRGRGRVPRMLVSRIKSAVFVRVNGVIESSAANPS